MKKILGIVLCLVMTLAAVVGLVACDPDQQGGGGSGSISVHYSAGGFGKEWMTKISSDYKALTGVTVKWVPSYTTGEIQSLVLNGQNQNDIVMPLLNMYQAQDAGRLEDLTDVYESTPQGETKAIKDKMNQSLYEYIVAKDGKRYQMFGSNSVSAFCYNIDTLNEAFGENNWQLPRTTNELLALANQLKTKGYYAFSTSTSINYYWDYVGNVWWAQYDGLESYRNYFQGKYYDAAANEWKLGTGINDTDGRKFALETLSTFIKKSNGYIHQLSDRMGFEEAQAAFLSNGYVDDDTKVAFMVNGDWLENEMASWLLQNPQNIGMMRSPVISKLAEKLTTVQTEEKLSAIVKAVDEGKTSYEGVSEEDFAAVRDARLMGYTATPNYPIGIPSYRPEAKKKLAKDFLTYLYSDRAQKIYANELQGLTMPAGFDVLSDSSVRVSDFVKTRLQNFGNDMIPVFPVNSSPVAYRGGLGDLPGISGPDKALYDGRTADAILKTCKEDMTSNWQDYIKWIDANS